MITQGSRVHGSVPCIPIYGVALRDVAVARFAPGATLFVHQMTVPDDVIDVGKMAFASNDRQIIVHFREPAIVVVRKLHTNLKSCDEVLFMRRARNMPDPTTWSVRPLIVPALIVKLRADKKRRRFDVHGGVQFAYTYPDEVCIADSDDGDKPCYKGWILERNEAIALASSGVPDRIWIIHRQIHKDDRTLVIQPTGYNPLSSPPAYADPDRNDAVEERIYQVDFDAGSQQVTRIQRLWRSDPLNGDIEKSVRIACGTIPERVSVGDILPYAYACLAREPEEQRPALTPEADDDEPIFGPRPVRAA